MPLVESIIFLQTNDSLVLSQFESKKSVFPVFTEEREARHDKRDLDDEDRWKERRRKGDEERHDSRHRHREDRDRERRHRERDRDSKREKRRREDDDRRDRKRDKR